MHKGGGRWVGSNKLVELKKKKQCETACPQKRAGRSEFAAPHYYYRTLLVLKIPWYLGQQGGEPLTGDP